MRYCICFMLVVFMLSCGNRRNGSSSGKKYQFVLKLSQGQKFYFDLTNEMQNKVAVDDKKIENKSIANIGLIYEVLKDSSSTGLLLKESTLTSMEGTIKVMGRELPIEISFKRKMTGRKL